MFGKTKDVGVEGAKLELRLRIKEIKIVSYRQPEGGPVSIGEFPGGASKFLSLCYFLPRVITMSSSRQLGVHSCSILKVSTLALLLMIISIVITRTKI